MKVDNLADAITQAMVEYTESVEEALPPIVDKTALAVLAEIKATAPIRTGKYAKGWKARRLGDKVRSKEGYAKLIHNPSRFQIAHLLEHGHAKRGGGRVAAKPHLGPAVDKFVPKMEQEIEDVIKRGGK